MRVRACVSLITSSIPIVITTVQVIWALLPKQLSTIVVTASGALHTAMFAVANGRYRAGIST